MRLYTVDDLLSNFKKGMKCITKDDMKRFYKTGCSLGRVITSLKLDGARLHAFTNGNTVQHKSYNLKDFENFGCLDEHIGALCATRAIREYVGPSAVMFDGEVLDRHAKTRNAKFKGVMQQLHRIHDLDDSGFKFHIFDFWFPGIPYTQEQRLNIIEYACLELGSSQKLAYHRHEVKSFMHEDMLTNYTKAILKAGHEGLVLKNPEGLYEMRRSPNWLKLVAEETLDLYVVDIIEGEGKLAGHVGKFVCDLDGKPVLVGPGSATHNELREWFIDANKRPKMIEVKFKERNESGALRHPRFYRRRDDKA